MPNGDTPKIARSERPVQPAGNWLARFGLWIRLGLGRWLQSWLSSRIWIILPRLGRETRSEVLLPLNLASLLFRRARITGQPLEALLADLLQSALTNRRQPDPVEVIWHSLTDRQREVACLIAQGYSNGEIAERLTISANTVRSHARHILHKFGCANRLELPELTALCPPEVGQSGRSPPGRFAK